MLKHTFIILYGLTLPLHAQTPPAPAVTSFQNVRIFDGKSAALTAPMNVLVRGNKIEKISATPIATDRRADTVLIDGGGRTLMFKDAWRYRDYVIDAFNRDLAFDAFIREQLAGDLLPAATPEDRRRQLVATAFLALGPTNYEEQNKDALRMDIVDEQVDTLGRAERLAGTEAGGDIVMPAIKVHDFNFTSLSEAV